MLKLIYAIFTCYRLSSTSSIFHIILRLLLTGFHERIILNILNKMATILQIFSKVSLHYSHNGLDSVSNHQPHHCLLSRLFRRRSKKTSKLRVTGHCAGNSPGTGEFPAQMASYAEKCFHLTTSSWFKVIAWCLVSEKPVPEPNMTEIIYAMWHHLATKG